MPRRSHLPEPLLHRPFSTTTAAEHGLSRHQLCHGPWCRIFPRTWRHIDHEMSFDDWILAARATLPDDARLTGITRLREIGIDHGPAMPLHFVVARDHHIATEGIMLHRTDRLPPCDSLAVTPTAAFLAYCVEATVLDAIIVGDWLLRERHMTIEGLVELACRDDWRAGAAQAFWISHHLRHASRSPGESGLRATCMFAGLPEPDLNVELQIEGRTIIVDLAWLAWRTVGEYEGSHHQLDRSQYVRDIERYARLRSAHLAYVQITKEHTRNPMRVVHLIHEALVAGGYTGPPPDFGARWRSLHRRIPAPPIPGSTRGR